MLSPLEKTSIMLKTQKPFTALKITFFKILKNIQSNFCCNLSWENLSNIFLNFVRQKFMGGSLKNTRRVCIVKIVILSNHHQYYVFWSFSKPKNVIFHLVILIFFLYFKNDIFLRIDLIDGQRNKFTLTPTVTFVINL